MAFPSIRSQANTDGTSASGTPVVNLPATIKAGDTIFVVFRVAVAGAIGWPDATWNELFDASPDAADDQWAAAWRKADGTEGSTITLSCTLGKFAAIAYAIQDAADPALRAPELSTVATGSATEPDATTCTPTGGSKDYLWLTFFGMEGEQTGVTAYPANYTLGQSGLANSGTGAAVTTNVTMAGAARQNTAASEDAGAWDVTGTLDDWSAYTIAFHPAIAVTAGLENGRHEGTVPAPRRAATMAALTIAVNLLQTTLNPIQAAPLSQPHWPTHSSRAWLAVSASSRPQVDAVAAFAQTAWSNPQRSRAPLVGFTARSVLETPPPPQAPFSPVAWPNPPTRIGIVASATTRPSDPPGVPEIRQHVWPVPVRARVLAPTWLQARPSFYQEPAAGPMPFAWHQWPTPTRRVGLSVSASSRPSDEAQAPAGDPVRPTAWANPRRAARPTLTWIHQHTPYYDNRPFGFLWLIPSTPRYRPIHVDPPNLLTSALASAPVPRPFSVPEWPTPRPRVRVALDRPNPLVTTTLAGAFDLAPYGRASWPPVARVRGLTLEPPLNLLTSTLSVAPSQDPLRQTDAPNPVSRRGPAITWTAGTLALGEPLRPIAWAVHASRSVPVRLDAPNLLTGTLGLPITAPVRPIAWPNPPVTPRAQLLTWTHERRFFYLEVLPPRVADLSVPAPRPRPAHTWLQERKTFYQDIQPFQARDWRVPCAVRSTRPDDPPNLLTTTLGAQAPAPTPIVPCVWPVPTGRGATPIATSPNLLTTSLAPAPVATPFAQAAWPNPSLSSRVAPTWTLARALAIDARPPVPSPQWPVPVALRGAPASAPQNLLASTLSPEHEPRRPLLWPNPPVVRQAAGLESQPVQTAVSGGLLSSPVIPIAWVTPLAARPAPHTWIQERKAYYEEVQPCGPYDWPLPVRPRVIDVGELTRACRGAALAVVTPPVVAPRVIHLVASYRDVIRLVAEA